MIVCPACSHRNPEGAVACEACGRSLERFAYRACPSCGALNPAQNTFCQRCLEELVPIGSNPEAAPKVDETEDWDAWPERPESWTPLAQQARAQAAEERLESPEEQPSGRRAQAEEPEPTEAAPTVTPTEELASPEESTPPSEAALPSEVAPSTASFEEPEAPLEAPPSEAPPPSPVPESPPAELVPDISISLLEGLGDVIAVEPVVTLPHRATPPPSQTLEEDEQQEAALFYRIASERAPLHEPGQPSAPRQGKGSSLPIRTGLYLLVLLAALVPLFSQGLTAGWAQPREGIVALSRTFQSLPAGSTVLLSFDYSPTYAGELTPLALAVVRQLAAHSVRIVAMSTRPEGVGLAQQILFTLSREQPAYRYGEDYVLLGYLPGQEAGLRSLSYTIGNAFKQDALEQRPLDDLPLTRGLATVQDFDHVIVLADDSQLVRRWIEQVQGRTAISLHALVTAWIEPTLMPYRQSGQLLSLIGGATGTTEYELASGMPVSAPALADGYTALFAILLLVAIVTNAVALGTRKRNPDQELRG